MNNIKSILEEQEKEFKKKGFCKRKNGKWEYTAEDWNKIVDIIQSFIRQSQKKLITEVIKELVGEEAGEYYRLQTGYNQHRAEAKAKGEEIIKEL